MAKIEGGLTGTEADVHTASRAINIRPVNDSGARIGRAGLEQFNSTDIAFPIGGVNDVNFRLARMDRMGNFGTTRHSPAFMLTCDGAGVNNAQIFVSTSTQNLSQTTTSGINLNSTGVISANSSALISSLKPFPLFPRGPLFFRSRIRLIKGGTNGVAEWGIGSPTVNNPLITGAMWQYAADGTLKPVLLFNGTPTATGIDISSLIDSTRYYWYDIIVTDDGVIFSVQDSATRLIINEQVLTIGVDAGRMFASVRLPVFARTYVGGAPATNPATQLYIAQMYVGIMDADLSRPLSEFAASIGHDGIRNPQTGVQLPVHTNNAASGTLTLSNTTPGSATPGGRFAFAATAGGLTDYLLFSYQVPTGYQFMLTDFTVDMYNDGAASAAQHVFEWSLGYDGTVASLAAGGHIREFIGIQTIASGAVIGAPVSPPIREKFTRGRKIDAGRFLAVILRIPVGTATPSELFRGAVNINGYFSE